jgi:signal transduction histidine kinase
MLIKARNRLLLVNMCVITAIMLVAFVAVYALTYANIQSENSRRIDSIGPMLARGVVPSMELSTGSGNPLLGGTSGEADSAETVITNDVAFSPEQTRAFVLIASDNGHVLEVASRLNLSIDDYLEAYNSVIDANAREGTLRLADRLWQYRVSSTTVRATLFGSALGEATATRWQFVFLDVTDSALTLTRLAISFCVTGVVMLVALFLFSRFAANRAILPLVRSWERQRQFVADASHELKTPLAIIEANREALLLEDSPLSDGQRGWLGNIHAETKRMGDLVARLLYLSRMEEEAVTLEPCALPPLIDEVTAAFEVVLFEKGVSLDLCLPDDAQALPLVKAEPGALRQILSILTENATKHTPPGGEVRITAAAERGAVTVSVCNSPAFIPPESIGHVFERFYRVDASHSKGDGSGPAAAEAGGAGNAVGGSGAGGVGGGAGGVGDDGGGFGLGLAIALAAAERIGAGLKAASGNGVVTFTLTLKPA